MSIKGMISIEEAIQSNNRVIGICFLVFILASFVAWAFTIRRERRVKKLIRRAVAKAEARAREETREECHEKALDNFIHWMETLRELKKTQKERDELKRKYDILYQAAEGCPGMTAAKIGLKN